MLYKCLLYCRSPTSQGPHSFQGYNTHKQHQERNEQSGEVSSSAVNHAVLPDTNVTSDLSSLKAFCLASQSREPAFDSVGVSKLCSLGWAVLVSEPWAQQRFLTAVQLLFACCLLTGNTGSPQLSVRAVILPVLPTCLEDPAYAVRIFCLQEEQHGKDWGEQGKEEGGAGDGGEEKAKIAMEWESSTEIQGEYED